jgi:hypothetical protein
VEESSRASRDSSRGSVQEPQRQVCREPLLQELDSRVLADLDLGRENQRATRRCARFEKHPQPPEQQALNLIRRQSFELSRSHLDSFVRRKTSYRAPYRPETAPTPPPSG